MQNIPIPTLIGIHMCNKGVIKTQGRKEERREGKFGSGKFRDVGKE